MTVDGAASVSDPRGDGGRDVRRVGSRSSRVAVEPSTVAVLLLTLTLSCAGLLPVLLLLLLLGRVLSLLLLGTTGERLRRVSTVGLLLVLLLESSVVGWDLSVTLLVVTVETTTSVRGRQQAQDGMHPW